MARHQRMPTLKAGYTYAVVPTVINQNTCIEGESIYGRLGHCFERPLSANWGRLLVPEQAELFCNKWLYDVSIADYVLSKDQ